MRALRHDPGGATRAVELSWDAEAGALRVQDGGRTLAVSGSDLALLRGGWDGRTLHVTWEAEGRTQALSLSDPAAVEELGALLPGALGEEARRLAASGAAESRRGRFRAGSLVAGLAVALLLLVSALWLFRDAILDALVARLPTAVDRQIGALALEQAAPGLQDTGTAAEAVRSVGLRLVGSSRLPAARAFEFQFRLARDASVNAYAAPGGLVVVHAGLVAAAESGEELAGVLAHEAAHVIERHSVRQLVHDAGLAVALRLAFGSPEGSAAVLATAMRDLGSLGFSRQQELQADHLGRRLLAEAHLPAGGMARFFERLAKEPQPPRLLSTHPHPGERAAALRGDSAVGAPADVVPLALDWNAVRADARAVMAATP